MSKKLSAKTTALILFLLVAGIVIVYILSIFTRFPNSDEGIMGEHAYFLSRLGYAKSNLWEGFGYGWEVRQFHYHKFFVIIGMVIIKLFGYSIYHFRISSVVFFLLFTCIFYLYSKPLKENKNYLLFLLSVFILLINNVFYDYIFIYRPEVVLMLFGFTAFFFMDKNLKSRSVHYLVLSAIFAGLSVFTHLNGLIFVFAGFSTYLFNKKYKAALIFGVISGVVSSLYFYDLLSKAEFSGFVYQFFNEPSLAQKQSHPLLRMFTEYVRFFHSPKETLFSLLFFICLGYNFKYLRKRYFNLLIYTLGAMVGLAVISHSHTPKYALLYYPFMAIIISIGILRIREHKKVFSYLMIPLLVIFTGLNLYFNIRIIKKTVNVPERNRYMASLLPQGGHKVMAFETFIFNEIKNYTINGPIAYRYYFSSNRPGYKPDIYDFFEFADKNNDRYILIDWYFMNGKLYKEIQPETIRLDDVINNYKLVTAKDSAFIFENTRLMENQNQEKN